MESFIRACFGVDRPIIGMVHLPALPGSPGFNDPPSGDGRGGGDGAGADVDAISDAMLADVRALADHGVHGLMIENFGDAPFYPDRVPAETVAHFTALAGEVRNATDLPIGINVLRNDGRSALAIAHAVDAQFIRVNILCGARVTDQGLMQGIAHELMRDRARLGAGDIAVLADVNVKHSAPLASIPLQQEVHDLVQRGRADALIVSGTGTGATTDREELEAVRDAAGDCPVLLGSGVTADNIADYIDLAEGFIVGSSLKFDGIATHRVDVDRVRALISALG